MSQMVTRAGISISDRIPLPGVAFKSMSRLAREVYDAPALADVWDSIATKIQEAIWARCTATGTYGRQFVEGAMADETLVKLHDGEGTDTTLMPFYGFCAPDDPAYLNHARLAVTPENPYLFKEGDGI
jgi:meiotically up-regulated gene 157 (Mug157) protein